MPHAAGAQRASNRTLRTLWLLAALVALGALLGVRPAVGRAQAAAAPLKAVIVVGPSGDTAQNKVDADGIAARAAAHGMSVRKFYSPYADWASVSAAADGASLLVYLGHGNGWPSPYAPYQPETKNGMGLNAERGSRSMRYYGEGPISREIRLAPNAVVILNHLCYASGNGEPGMSIPSQTVAIERVDNFAAGFIGAGARAVFAYAWQDGADVVDGLFVRGRTMHQVFGIGAETWGDPGTADILVGSKRRPGKQNRLDKRAQGYQRAVTGDLDMNTDAFLSGAGTTPDPTPTPLPTASGSAKPTPTAPSASPTASAPTASPSIPAPTPSPTGTPLTANAPQLTALAVQETPDTRRYEGQTVPIFTPNGDGLSDTVSVAYALSAPAALAVQVAGPAGAVVRRFTVPTAAGGRFAWGGYRDDGSRAADGTYSLRVTPTANGANGDTRTVAVRLLTTLAAPAVAPRLFYARDEDQYARTTSMTVRVTRPATVSWTVHGPAGGIVAVNFLRREVAPGQLAWTWDGRDRYGEFLPAGHYLSWVTAHTAAGSYVHAVPVTLGAFRITPAAPLRRGVPVVVEVLSAERLQAAPTVRVSQAGHADWTLPARNMGYNRYEVTLTPRVAGGATSLTIVASGVDLGGQSQKRTATLPLP